MEKKEDGIFVSKVFLESIKQNLIKHCSKCKPDWDSCWQCKVGEVLDDIEYIIEFAVDYD